jgi:hypothetical protein
MQAFMPKEKTEKFICGLAAMKYESSPCCRSPSGVAIGEIPIGLTFVKYAYTTARGGRTARLCSNQ